MKTNSDHLFNARIVKNAVANLTDGKVTATGPKTLTLSNFFCRELS